MDLEKLFNYFFSNFLIESLRFFFNEFALIFNNSVLSPILSTTFSKKNVKNPKFRNLFFAG